MIQIIITSSALILLILLLRQIMKRKISLRLQYSLWGLAIVLFIVGCTFTGAKDSKESSNFEQENMLTIEEVIELAKKGEDLGFEDFLGYDGGTEIGSGLYIYHYPIVGGKYALIIGGTGPTEKPFYIKLQTLDMNTGAIDINTDAIDIRTDDIQDYLSRYNVDLRLMIYFNDNIYYDSSIRVDLDSIGLVKIGEVIGVVNSSAMPSENGYANHNIKGGIIYERGDDIILYWRNEYFLYEPADKGDLMPVRLEKQQEELIKELKDQLLIGISKTDINEFTQTMPFKVKNAMYPERFMFRYEIVKKDTYTFSGEEARYDSLDIAGMINGEISLIVFVEFDEKDLLTHYTIYYIDEDGDIHEVRDGAKPKVIRARDTI